MRTKIVRATVRRICLGSAVVVATLFVAGADAHAGVGGVERAAGCGPARSDIRTLSDGNARRLAVRPVRTTVAALSGRSRPGVAKNRNRVRGVETTTFRIEVSLVGMRFDAGREVVLVVADLDNPAATIEVRFPFSGCAGRRSAMRGAILSARAALTSACGKPGRGFMRLAGDAVITGVGYLGTAPAAGKGVGLAPALRFKDFGCGRVLAAHQSPATPAALVAPTLPAPPPREPPSPPPPPAPRWFNEQSPFNMTADAYGAPVPIPASWLPDFDGTGSGALQLSRSWEQGKAIFRAGSSDPVTASFHIADASQCFDDVIGCAHWQPVDPDHRVPDDTTVDPDHIPIPAGVRCPGLPTIDNLHDRALVVISADGKTAWEFWHCTHAATSAEPFYTAAVAVRWDLDPDDPSPAARGYQDEGLTATGSQSARASGMPLLTTTITPREALSGINHPIGLTVKAITTGYVNPPASHTDVCDGCSHLKYGMLFVLNPAFQPPADATPAELSIVAVLKEYGAFVTDRGPLFELDGSPNEPTDPSHSDQLWAEAQDGNLARLNIRPADFLYVRTPGAPPAVP